MGDLPASRVSSAKPFLHVGIDYAGPFFITMGKTRGGKTLKAYICLFVCFTTRALHLELASDLSAETFLAALRRFVARRGRCQHLYSDCGTNFISAHRQLIQFMQRAAATEKIAWHFNPPAGPHFGGIWEAGVKSVKTHLLRVVGEQRLTFEELSTLLAQIEAMLNSRPLTPLSCDPNDLSALTPGHFLTSEPLVSLPEPALQDVPLSRLNRWQLVQRMNQDLWTRWSKEYLHTLMQRSKWHKHQAPLPIGTLVLLKEESSPPLRWRLARILETHPGLDGIVRVVSVRTVNGVLKRPVVKICPLPL